MRDKILIRPLDTIDWFELGNLVDHQFSYNEDYEEITHTILVRDFDIKVIELMLGLGIMYNVSETLLYGYYPSSSQIWLDYVLLEDIIITSGIPWKDILSGECSQIDLEFVQRKVTLAKYTEFLLWLS